MGVSIYLDESGDPGWIFDQPYGNGGSSRFMTLAAAVVDDSEAFKLGRIVRGFYKARGRQISNELKSHHLKSKERRDFCRQAIDLSQKIPSLKFFAITVYKPKVNMAFQQHQNGLYNYMVKLLLLPEMAKHSHVSFIPDARDVKTELKLALDDYLRMELAIAEATTVLTTTPWESRVSLDLQFADYLAGCIWSCHEYGQCHHLQMMAPVLTEKRLFFP